MDKQAHLSHLQMATCKLPVCPFIVSQWEKSFLLPLMPLNHVKNTLQESSHARRLVVRPPLWPISWKQLFRETRQEAAISAGSFTNNRTISSSPGKFINWHDERVVMNTMAKRTTDKSIQPKWNGMEHSSTDFVTKVWTVICGTSI